MSVLAKVPGAPPRRASLAVAFAAGIMLLVAPLSAAVVNPWQGTPSATPVASTDAPGLNVLEPADKDTATVAAVKGPGAGEVERVVGEWNPTGGGNGGGGSKKK